MATDAAGVKSERLLRRRQIRLLAERSVEPLCKRGAKHLELDADASQTTHSPEHLSPRSEVTKWACRQDDWCSCCRPLTLSLFFPTRRRRHLKQNHQPPSTLIQMSSKLAPQSLRRPLGAGPRLSPPTCRTASKLQSERWRLAQNNWGDPFLLHHFSRPSHPATPDWAAAVPMPGL